MDLSSLTCHGVKPPAASPSRGRLANASCVSPGALIGRVEWTLQVTGRRRLTFRWRIARFRRAGALACSSWFEGRTARNLFFRLKAVDQSVKRAASISQQPFADSV